MTSRLVGNRMARIDGLSKVTGSATYVGDLVIPGTCEGIVVRSPYPHAVISSLELDRARAVPGVLAIIGYADLPGPDHYYGHVVPDHPILADGKVRYAGEPVVAIAANDGVSAMQAARQVEVRYEELPFVDRVEDAADGDVLVHDRPGNVCAQSVTGWSDVDAAMSTADVVVEGEYRYPNTYAYAMEPYIAVASFSGGTLTVWSSAQHPFVVRTTLARCFGLPLSRVRVAAPLVGGGYGSKSFTKIEPLAAALTLTIGRPVRLALSIEESVLTTRGDGAITRLRTGFTADGHIVARDATVLLDTGAYAESSPGVAEKASRRLGGPYRIPALRVDSSAIYTNTPPASSLRGFGAPQVVWASEQQMNVAAEQLGLDQFEIRLRNLVRPGEAHIPGYRPMDADLGGDLELLRDGLAWDSPCRPGRARGIALSVSDAGYIPVSTAEIHLNSDGSATVYSGSVEMGQGSATVIAQVVGEELGLTMDQIDVLQGDTGTVPFETSTGASRTTTLAGAALVQACEDTKEQLRVFACEAFGLEMSEVIGDCGGIRAGDKRYLWADIIRAWFGGDRGAVIGRGYVRQAGVFAQLPPFWEVGCVGVEVSLDAQTGVVRIEHLVTVGDVGKAINPDLVEGQDLGAAVMGLGMAVYEELVFADGELLNGNIVDYRVPRASDINKFTSRIAERADGTGPYGVKGSGEGALNPVAPAIASALTKLTGRRHCRAPLSPVQIWRDLYQLDG